MGAEPSTESLHGEDDILDDYLGAEIRELLEAEAVSRADAAQAATAGDHVGAARFESEAHEARLAELGVRLLPLTREAEARLLRDASGPGTEDPRGETAKERIRLDELDFRIADEDEGGEPTYVDRLAKRLVVERFEGSGIEHLVVELAQGLGTFARARERRAAVGAWAARDARDESLPGPRRRAAYGAALALALGAHDSLAIELLAPLVSADASHVLASVVPAQLRELGHRIYCARLRWSAAEAMTFNGGALVAELDSAVRDIEHERIAERNRAALAESAGDVEAPVAESPAAVELKRSEEEDRASPVNAQEPLGEDEDALATPEDAASQPPADSAQAPPSAIGASAEPMIAERGLTLVVLEPNAKTKNSKAAAVVQVRRANGTTGKPFTFARSQLDVIESRLRGRPLKKRQVWSDARKALRVAGIHVTSEDAPEDIFVAVKRPAESVNLGVNLDKNPKKHPVRILPSA